MSKAAATRLAILQKAFELIYVKGYQATSIDEILSTTQVTKGAFFYHFKNKDEMGLAMINEVMYPGMQPALIEPLLKAENPRKEIYAMMKGLLLENTFFKVKYGCPAVNLTEEMAPLNEEFGKALSVLISGWQKAIESSLKKGKAIGKIDKEVDPKQASYFIISGYTGIRNLGKIYGKSCYKSYLDELQRYLAGMK